MRSKSLEFTWEDFERDWGIAMQSVLESGFTPTTLITTTRWGCLPGFMASILFPKALQAIIPIRTRTEQEYRYVYFPGNIMLLPSEDGTHIPIETKRIPVFEQIGNSILVIDHLNDTGLTLQYVTRMLKEALPRADIQTMVVWTKEGSAFSPTYIGRTIFKDPVTGECPWIEPPWEVAVKRLSRNGSSREKHHEKKNLSL